MHQVAQYKLDKYLYVVSMYQNSAHFYIGKKSCLDLLILYEFPIKLFSSTFSENSNKKLIFGISFYQFIELNEKNKIFLWNIFYFSSLLLCGSAPNSQSFQSSIKSINTHNNTQIKLLKNGLFGKKYISSKFHNPLQIITIQIHTKKIFRFELWSFLKFLILFITWFVFFHILFFWYKYYSNNSMKNLFFCIFFNFWLPF